MSYKRLTPQRIVIIIACMFLLITIIYQQFAGRQEIFASLQQLEPNAFRYEQVPGSYPAYKLWDKEDNVIGYAVKSSASGYGGPLDVLVSVAMNGSLKKVIITDNCETPSYLSRVLRADYLNQFTGKSVSSSLVPGRDLDTVSGATYTVKGIAQAVRKGAAQVGQDNLGIQVNVESPLHLGWQELGLVILYGLTIAGVSRKYHKLRPWVLAASVIFLGFIYNGALSLANLTSIISGNPPSFLEHPFWYLLTVGILVLTLLWGKNIYCSWLCPFGGLQEGIHKALGFMKFNISQQITELAHKIRWGVIWAAVMVALIFSNPSIATYEPFAVSFGGQGNLGHWLILCLVLLTGIIISRVWCRFVCPVGAVLNYLASLKGKISVRFQPKDTIGQCPGHSNCPAQVAHQQTGKWRDLTIHERIFLGILLTYIVLIAITLSLNL